jgi:hypothetical protein
VQIEELEGAFADFEEYTVQLAEKRTSIYETFERASSRSSSSAIASRRR